MASKFFCRRQSPSFAGSLSYVSFSDGGPDRRLLQELTSDGEQPVSLTIASISPTQEASLKDETQVSGGVSFADDSQGSNGGADRRLLQDPEPRLFTATIPSREERGLGGGNTGGEGSVVFAASIPTAKERGINVPETATAASPGGAVGK